MVILRLAFCQPPSSLVGWLDGGPSHDPHFTNGANSRSCISSLRTRSDILADPAHLRVDEHTKNIVVTLLFA